LALPDAAVGCVSFLWCLTSLHSLRRLFGSSSSGRRRCYHPTLEPYRPSAPPATEEVLSRQAGTVVPRRSSSSIPQVDGRILGSSDYPEQQSLSPHKQVVKAALLGPNDESSSSRLAAKSQTSGPASAAPAASSLALEASQWRAQSGDLSTHASTSTSVAAASEPPAPARAVQWRDTSRAELPAANPNAGRMDVFWMDTRSLNDDAARSRTPEDFDPAAISAAQRQLRKSKLETPFILVLRNSILDVTFEGDRALVSGRAVVEVTLVPQSCAPPPSTSG